MYKYTSEIFHVQRGVYQMAPVFIYVSSIKKRLPWRSVGLKYIQMQGKEVVVEGFKKKCICAFFKPNDDPDRF